MKKTLILIFISALVSIQAIAESGVAFDRNRLKEEIRERVKGAKKKGSRFNMVGTVSANRSDYLMVNGEIFKKESTTNVIGKLGVGSNVKVKGFIQRGEKVLTHIIVSQKINNSSKLKDDEKLNFDGEHLASLPDDSTI